MRLLHLSPEMAGTLRNLWQPWTDAIAKRCELPAAPFVRDILSGADTVHLIWDDDRAALRGVVITTFTTDDFGKTVCYAPYCTGEGIEEWFFLIDELERWAREHGAASMKTMARMGWTRLMKPLGYRTTHAMLEKVL